MFLLFCLECILLPCEILLTAQNHFPSVAVLDPGLQNLFLLQGQGGRSRPLLVRQHPLSSRCEGSSPWACLFLDCWLAGLGALQGASTVPGARQCTALVSGQEAGTQWLGRASSCAGLSPVTHRHTEGGSFSWLGFLTRVLLYSDAEFGSLRLFSQSQRAA